MTTALKRPAQASKDIYERVTNQIIAAIEAGAGEYRTPWHHDGSSNTTPITAGAYPSGLWGTYRQ